MRPERSFFRKALWAVLALAVVLCAAVLWHFGPRLFYRYFGYLALSPQKGEPSPEQRARLRRALAGLRAQVVWSSSRSGNHEIYLRELPSLKTRRLTNHPHVDFFPRFSPDGRRLVFNRSRRPWVSEREASGWDVYMLDLASGRERRVAQGGKFPQWLDDRFLSFMRGPQVVVLELASGRERVIYDGRRPPNRGALETPELAPGAPFRLAFTARGRLYGGLVVDLRNDAWQRYGDGCELGWFPDGRRLLWVADAGRGGTRIMASPYPEPAPKVLMDLPGPLSHEYFVRMSRDGRWLVWGASAGGHEHDIADYEIFLWRLGTPWQKALRLTYNPGNDRWPDIFILAEPTGQSRPPKGGAP